MDFSLARAFGACLILVGVRVDAAEGALTLAQALETALARSPELAASNFALSAAQRRVLQAGQRPQPEASLELENFAGSGGYSGSDSLETTLSLSQVIELGGKRDSRLAFAGADQELAALERHARELDLLAETTRRFVDAAEAERHRASSAEAEQLARETFAAISRRVDAARSPIAERSRARNALIRAEIDLAQADSDARTARQLLAASWGDAAPTFASVQADLFAFEPSDTFEAWFVRLERNPDLVRLASQSRLKEAELRLVQANSRPDLTLSLGLRRFEADGETALVAGVSMPMSWGNRNQGIIDEARANLSRNEAERAAALHRLRAQLFALYQGMETARMRAVRLRGEALPMAREALEQTRAGYERGRFSFLELASAQSELLEIETAALEAAADHHRLRTELERLTGEAAS